MGGTGVSRNEIKFFPVKTKHTAPGEHFVKLVGVCQKQFGNVCPSVCPCVALRVHVCVFVLQWFEMKTKSQSSLDEVFWGWEFSQL